MPRIPEEDIARIKQTTDLAALVRSRGVELKNHGSKDLVGRCPFHEDEGPSLVVSPAKGLFHCMGCGAAGNAIQFVERFDGVSFRHAFELLSGGLGFAAPVDQPTVKATVPKLPAPVAFDADDAALLQQITDYYHQRLWKNPQALAYLKKRGLDDEAMLQRFKVGFADRSLGLTLPHKNRKEGAEIRTRLTKLGVYRESGHEHFNGCIVIPILDAQGQVVGLYGRRLDDGGKAGIKHLYLPGPHAGIFNAEALEHPEVILCEAILDALTFVAAGFENVTCIYGTEGFTEELFAALKRPQVQRIKLAYDADEAGERAAARDAAKLGAVGLEVSRIKFPWGMDANEYARKVQPANQSLKLLVNGAQWLGKGQAPVHAAAIAPAPLLPSSLAAEVSSQLPPEPPAAKEEKGLSDAVPGAPGAVLVASGDCHMLTLEQRQYRLAGLSKNSGPESFKLTLRLKVGECLYSDQVDLCKDSERRRFIERAADETGLSHELVKRDLGKLLLACEAWQEERLRAQQAPTTPAAEEMSEAERTEALALLRDPALMERIAEAFSKCGIVGESTNTLAAYLACTSRKLARPLAVIIQSSSAAGKSTLMEAVLRLFPEEERIKYSAMTGQSLYYLGETNLRHKILAIVEEEGAEKASYALKLLQSEGELTIASTGKDPHTGRMETQQYHVQGPVMIFLTTTALEIDEELMNRCLVLTVDEGREQTERIHALQRQARTLEGLVAKHERAALVRALRNAQRLLQPYDIINPYAHLLTFSASRTRSRRDHEKYLTLIDAIALLHQHQRPLEKRQVAGQEIAFIRATVADIALANQLAAEVLARSLDELPTQTRKLWDHVRALVEEKKKAGARHATFSRREVRERCGWSVTQVRVHLERLAELDYLALRGGRMGAAMVYECLIDTTEGGGEVVSIGLLDTERLARYDGNLTGLEAA